MGSTVSLFGAMRTLDEGAPSAPDILSAERVLKQQGLFSGKNQEKVQTLTKRLMAEQVNNAVREAHMSAEELKATLEAGELPDGDILTILRKQLETINKNHALVGENRKKFYSANKILNIAEKIDAKNLTQIFHNIEVGNREFDRELFEAYEKGEREEIALQLCDMMIYLGDQDVKRFFESYAFLPEEIKIALNEEVHRKGGCICQLGTLTSISEISEQSERAMEAAFALSHFMVNGFTIDTQSERKIQIEDLKHLD